MEQNLTALTDIFGLILYLGAITFLSGAVFQVYILLINKRAVRNIIFIVLLTRILTVISSYFSWIYWNLPVDIMFLFFFLPAILPETVLSLLILKIFGNKIKGVESNI